MYGTYFLLGILTAGIGALPVGAANLAVLNAALQKNSSKVNQLTLAAGMGEITIVLFSLLFSMQLFHFFQEYHWIRFIFIFLFLSLGICFLTFQNKIPAAPSIRFAKKTPTSILGFLLALVNPPVFVYWIAAITILNRYFLMLNEYTAAHYTLLFITGVYIGKIGVLYGYAKWGNRLAKKSTPSTSKMYTTIGLAFLLISIIQSIHLVY